MSKYNQKGFVAFFIAILVLVIVFGIVLSISFLTLSQQKISSNIIKSSQAHYVAEAGIEDALVRLTKGMNFSSSYNLIIGQGTATIEISDLIGGSLTITSFGNVSDRIRKIRVIRIMSTKGVSFFYGAQAGDGGIDMEADSVIHGNVFSNGTIQAVTGTAKIDNSAIVAKSGNRLVKIEVGTLGNIPPDQARAHTCINSVINGDLYYVAGGSSNCVVNGGSERVLPNNIDSVDMPFSDEQISNWEDEAVDGGIEFGDHTVLINTTESLGAKKIEGNLIIENNATLIITGTLWVTGDITTDNRATIRLDDDYGSTSGILISYGKILVENDVVLEGSGTPGSYIMLLSTSNSTDLDAPAIFIKNNAQGAIFYTSDGMIRLRNNINIREATGWKLYLDNNAEITYESGLADLLFSNGPGGSWQIADWREIE